MIAGGVPRPEPGRAETTSHGFADTLRSQFRAAMKALTRSISVIKLRTRRTEDKGEGFKALAVNDFQPGGQHKAALRTEPVMGAIHLASPLGI